jgi:hypothetical protein
MAWRLLMRRCPARSMTLVGDVAQTGDLSGAASWAQVLEPYVATRWRLAELTVSYRTPAEIMTVAAGVLAGIDPTLEPPRAVRAAGLAPWRAGVPPERLAAEVVAAVLRETAEIGDRWGTDDPEVAGANGATGAGGQAGGGGAGRLGVIVPAALVGELGRALTCAVPEATVGEEPDLRSRVVVLTVRQAKGLEFDSVLLVDPAGIVAESPRGRSDLYVALTRSTHRLGVLHPGDDLPAAVLPAF